MSMPPRRTYRPVAAALLLVGGAAQFGWHHAPPAAQADVWNASQALLVLLLLAMVMNAYRAPFVWGACTLLGSYQALTAGCSLVWLWHPWPIEAGQGQCSAGLNWPLGMVQGWLLVLLASRLHGSKDNNDNDTDNHGGTRKGWP